MHQFNITQRLPLTLLVYRAVSQVQLLNIRGSIIYNHPTELIAGMYGFAMALYVITRAVGCANSSPVFCLGAGGASNNIRRAIFLVT